MPTLVVMAAGLGTRFGGPKQIVPVGPSGETLMDYQLFDAARAGFERAVLVIRDELAAAIEPIARRHRQRLQIDIARQQIGQGVPRGTVPAVLAARSCLNGPFGALNADDFYGRDAFVQAAAFLRDPTVSQNTHAVVTFPLEATLSPHGPVVRAICAVQGDLLVALTEVSGIRRERAHIGAAGRTFTGRERVSMNFWAFQPPILDEFASELALVRANAAPTPELLLPVTLDTLIAQGRARVRVLSVPGPWLGLTHASDLPGVRDALRDLTVRGEYPSPVWT